MSKNTKRPKKGKSARKFPESTGLNAAGNPVANQLNNVEERPVIPMSRMPTQEPTQSLVYAGSHLAAGNSSTTVPSWGPGPSQPFLSASQSELARFPPSINAYYPLSQSFIPAPPPIDYQSAPPALLTADFDAHSVGQPSQSHLHPYSSIGAYHHLTNDEPEVETCAFEDDRSTMVITRMDEAILHQRRPLRFRAAPYPDPHAERQPTAQPTIPPYTQHRADIAEQIGLTKLRPGELVRGAEFSAGVIRVVENSFRGVRKQTGVRLPPPPSGHTVSRATISSEPGPSPSTESRVADSKDIFDRARDETKQYMLGTNAMPTRDDLLSILKLVVGDALGKDHVQKWVEANGGTVVRRLADACSYVRTPFKDYAAHNVQDVFHLREATAIQNGCSAVEWKRKEVRRLMNNFVFLSADTLNPLDLNSGNTMISDSILNLVTDVLFIEGLSQHVDLNTSDFIAVSALAATMYYWALEQHARGCFVPLDFVVEKYTPVYTKIKEMFRSISTTQSFASFVQAVRRHGQSLLGI